MQATEAGEPPDGLARVLAEVTVRIARESIGAGAAPNEVAFQVKELLASFGEATSSAQTSDANRYAHGHEHERQAASRLPR
jgi:hypothetical protein